MGQNRDNLQLGLQSFPVEDYLIFYRVISGKVQVLRILSGYRNLETIF
jgi:toxin ParE1/3/4